jgi:CheY-like chemotaxis protein
MEQKERLGFKLPIVAVTGFSSSNDMAKCLREGFNYVIVKPATKSLI